LPTKNTINKKVKHPTIIQIIDSIDKPELLGVGSGVGVGVGIGGSGSGTISMAMIVGGGLAVEAIVA
jgi:hypothetical protein